MKKLITILVSAVLMCSTAASLEAQQRASVDITSITVNKGKKITTQKSLYYRNNGRLIIDQTAPDHFVYSTNALGEMKIYNPATNQVMVASDEEFSSTKELFTMFASGNYLDMGLPRYGYEQSSVETVDGKIVKTYTSNSAATKGVVRVELVFERHTPQFMAYYNSKGEPIRKVWFSNFTTERMLMPARITDIGYLPDGDSTVILNIYQNFRFDREADSPMFDFKVPDDAEPIQFNMPQ